MKAANNGNPVQRGVSLQALNSFGCPCVAEHLFSLTAGDEAAVRQAAQWLDAHPGGLMLGAGSNILLATERVAAVLHVKLRGIARLDSTPGMKPDEVLIRAAAGEVWDDFVRWTLAEQCYGLENLALIPGTVGAAPVQNIGAYGVEIAERIDTVEAFDRTLDRLVMLPAHECRFAYRDSVFKQQPGRWLITAVRFRLTRNGRPRLDYGNLRQALQAAEISNPTPIQVARIVSEIRQSKLPDPAVLGNAGSFFKNPVVALETADQLRQRWPGLPVYPASPLPAGGSQQQSLRKLPAGWLIEQCGLRGLRDGDVGVHQAHALVLVNYHHASGAQVLRLAEKVIARVRNVFGITLEPEPLIIRSA